PQLKKRSKKSIIHNFLELTSLPYLVVYGIHVGYAIIKTGGLCGLVIEKKTISFFGGGVRGLTTLRSGCSL
ncbi:MAG: hypothetical protein LBB43_03000, partial [Spirochaetaceae bacterium]|nr:hypothetical protein [Spirochaetaceae bacterium]